MRRRTQSGKANDYRDIPAETVAQKPADDSVLSVSSELSASDGSSLRRNFSWTLIGNVVYAGCQWAMLVAIAKLGSPEMLGTFVLGLALTAPVVILANLQLRGVQATDAKREYQFGTYWTLRLVTSSMAMMAIVVVTVASGCRGEQAAVVLVIGAAKVVESISDVVYGLLQQQERMDRIAISLMVKGPLSLLALGLCVSLTHSILWGALGLVMAWALSLACCDIPFGMSALRATMPPGKQTRSWLTLLRPQMDAGTLVRLARLALPLGVVMVLGSLIVNVPRYFVEAYQGSYELGMFAALASVNVAGTTVVSALGLSAQPRLARYYASGSARFLRLVIKLVAIGALVGCFGVLVAAVAGRGLLTVMFRPEYADNVSSFVWIMIAGGIGCIASFLGYGVTATRAFRRFVAPRVVTVLVAVAFSILLIPRHGVTGAAWVLCVANSVNCVGLVFILACVRRESRGTSA